MRKSRSSNLSGTTPVEGQALDLHPDTLADFHVLDMLPYDHIGWLPVVSRHVNIINTQ